MPRPLLLWSIWRDFTSPRTCWKKFLPTCPRAFRSCAFMRTRSPRSRRPPSVGWLMSLSWVSLETEEDKLQLSSLLNCRKICYMWDNGSNLIFVSQLYNPGRITENLIKTALAYKTSLGWLDLGCRRCRLYYMCTPKSVCPYESVYWGFCFIAVCKYTLIELMKLIISFPFGPAQMVILALPKHSWPRHGKHLFKLAIQVMQMSWN